MTFRFAQWSDPHGYTNGADLTNALIGSIPNLDCTINCGDTVHQLFGDDISYAHLENSLFVLGNHERIINFNGDFERNPPSQMELYQKFMQPYVNGWGVTINFSDYDTWWYKDYQSSKVRVIGIDCCVHDALVDKELDWLQSLLDESRKLGYAVLIASHEITTASSPTVVDCNFTDRWYFEKSGAGWPDTSNAELYPLVDKAYKAVNDFANNGGRVIAWLYGHEHADGIMLSRGISNKYPHVIIGSTLIDRFNDTYRDNSTYNTSRACVNYFEYDDVLGSLRLYRFGADGCVGGQIRKMLVYDYVSESFVASCGR